MKYVVKNSPAWFHDDNIPNDYRELFPDFVIIELINKTLSPVSSYIGGIYINEANEKSNVPSYQPVSADMQKKVLQKIFSTFYDLSWLDSNKDFLRLGGVNPDMSTWIYNNGYPMMSLMFRLMRMGLSVEKSTRPYTQEAYLNDIEKQLFKETLNGKPLSAPMIAQLSVYISSLKGMCPTLKAIDKAVSTRVTSIALNEQTNHKLQSLGLLTTFASISATEKQSGMEPMTSVNFYSGTDIEAICYDKLKSTRRYLIQARSLASNDIERGKCDYLIAMIDRVILPFLYHSTCMFIKSLVTVKCITIKKNYIMKQIILFIVFIFTIMMCSFAQEAPSSPIIKGRDNKSTEFFKNKKLQSPISPMVLFSQKITGVVYTEGGKEVLIGASVIEVGSTNGIITDIDGEYSIGISKADKKILQASYLGYETKQE